MALFSKKSSDTPSSEPDTSAEESPVVEHRAYTPGKGRATPKRTVAQRRKAEPPPKNRKEALARMRAKEKNERAERLAGMKSGDERYFLPRDKGPERAMVRDIIDSRRNAGPAFFAGAFIVLIMTMVGDPYIAALGNIIWLALAVAMIVDTFFICRKIKKMMRERFPKSTERLGSLYFYGGMRALSFRKLRMPKPRVNVGDKI
nr:DUF3043 domain-containing protein [Catelliglobosispora koreensis]